MLNKEKFIKPKEKVDLITINTISPLDALKTLEYSQKNIIFNRIILFSHEEPIDNKFEFIKIQKFQNIAEYSNFVLSLSKYLDSDFVLIVQEDGHIINPSNWSDKFLDYDYIGAPWPSSNNWLKRWDKYGNNVSNTIRQNIKSNRVGNGGFSLRSRKFLEFSSTFENCQGLSEDIFLSLYNYNLAKEFGLNFPSVNKAMQFSYETPLSKFFNKHETRNRNFNMNNHFGWHGKKFINSDYLINLKHQDN